MSALRTACAPAPLFVVDLPTSPTTKIRAATPSMEPQWIFPYANAARGGVERSHSLIQEKPLTVRYAISVASTAGFVRLVEQKSA